MIIFAHPDTGNVLSVIEGRLHSQKVMDMTMETSDVGNLFKLVVLWKPEKKEDGTTVWNPDVAEDQMQLFKELDANPARVYDYKIDFVENKLVPKSV